MASPGSEMERWAPKEAGEPMGPVASPESDSCLWPAKSLSQLPARADSAYSSFSGSCSVPECHGDQAAYLHSEYVTGISNLGAGGPERPWTHPSEGPHRGGRCPRGCVQERCGSAAPRRPRRSDGSRSPGREGDARDGDASHGHGRAGSTERDTGAAERTALQHKDSDLKNGLSKSQHHRVKPRENGERSLSQEPIKRSNAHVFSRPSSFIFQEYLKTDSLASAPKILSAFHSVHAYKIPKEMNSKACPLPHTSPNAVNDPQESKQHPCVVHKPHFGGAESAEPEPGRRRRSSVHAWCPAHTELQQDLGPDAFEDNHGLRYTEKPLPAKTASRKPSSCPDKCGCCDSEGELGSDAWEPALSQQAKMQKSSVSPSVGSAEPGCPRCGDLDRGDKPCCGHTNQTAFFRPKENATSHFLDEFNKEKQVNSVSPDLAVHLEQEQTAAPVCLHKHPRGLPNQPERLPQGDAGSEQISRQATPLLYYLSGGKSPRALQQRQHQEDARSLPGKSPGSSYCSAAQPTDAQRERIRLPKPQATHQRVGAEPSEAEDVVLGSPGSSLDESFQNDYREQLKVAQKRVLRETSFKRKDLQMSLPVRLRKKPSQRTSIEHLRSFSLSSANEDAKLAPGAPPHLQLVENFRKDEEIRRTQLGRVGGRKRVTKEQKKLCFSEPEKLNELEDKDVPWSRVRDETTEQDPGAAGRKAPEPRGRALSSSGVSRTELKQIQHTALMEYMERKISQRPGSTQHGPAPAAPAHRRPCYPQRPSGKVPIPHQARRSQNNEVSSQVFPEEEFPEVFAPVASAAPLSQSCGCHPSPTAPSKQHPSPNGARSCSGCASDGSSRSPPPATQEPSGGAGCAAVPAQSRDPCPGCPSFHDAEEDGCESHEDRDDNVAGSTCCWDRKDPETSILIPKTGNEEEPQGEKECRIQPPNGNTETKGPEEQLEVEDPQVKATHNPTVFAVHQGEPGSGAGLTTEEPSGQSPWDRVPPGGEGCPPGWGSPCPAEQRCEELARELAARDSSLAHVLLPRPLRRTALDLLEGLFPVSASVLEKSRRRRGEVQHLQENDRKGDKDPAAESPEARHDAEQREGDPVSMGNQALNSSRDSTNDLDDITAKKMELAWRLRRRLRALREERARAQAAGRACAERGGALEALVRALCKPNELERYLMFVGDLEKVLSLLLCLSSRLARVQNAMGRIDGNTDAEERQSLNERHQLLSRQREDAKDLKENLDRRERVVSGILAKYLTDQQLRDYRDFVEVKTSLLIEQKDLEEQIKLLEEQLENLEKSIGR